MPVWVLRVRQGFSATVCGVDADTLENTPETVRFYKDGAIVWSGPAGQVLTCAECADRGAARELMRQWGRDGAGKGALGPELVGIRPAAGGSRQIGQMVERVIADVGERDRSR